jgi:hypothetical protein
MCHTGLHLQQLLILYIASLDGSNIFVVVLLELTISSWLHIPAKFFINEMNDALHNYLHIFYLIIETALACP